LEKEESEKITRSLNCVKKKVVQGCIDQSFEQVIDVKTSLGSYTWHVNVEIGFSSGKAAGAPIDLRVTTLLRSEA